MEKEELIIICIFTLTCAILIADTWYLSDLKHKTHSKDTDFTYIQIDHVDNIVPTGGDDYYLTGATLSANIVLPHEEEKHDETKKEPETLSGNVRILSDGTKQFKRSAWGISSLGLSVKPINWSPDYVKYEINAPPGKTLKEHYMIQHIDSVDNYISLSNLIRTYQTVYYSDGSQRFTVKYTGSSTDELEYFIKSSDMELPEFTSGSGPYINIS